MKPATALILGLAIGLPLGGSLARRCTPASQRAAPAADTITVTHTDTITVTTPAPITPAPTPIRTDTATLPTLTAQAPDPATPPQATRGSEATPRRDSATVAIPITQTEYADSNYHAWISGYHARLDSIEIYAPRTVVTIRERPRRWSLGIHAGYGYTPRGLQPYIGLGITYTLWEF